MENQVLTVGEVLDAWRGTVKQHNLLSTATDDERRDFISRNLTAVNWYTMKLEGTTPDWMKEPEEVREARERRVILDPGAEYRAGQQETLEAKCDCGAHLYGIVRVHHCNEARSNNGKRIKEAATQQCVKNCLVCGAPVAPQPKTATPAGRSKEDFTFQVSVRGYMLQYKGQNIGGVSILGNYKGNAKQKQIKESAQDASREVEKILTGRGQQRFIDAIAKIEEVSKQ